MDLHLALARRTNAAARFGGIALNTSALDAAAAARLLGEHEARHGLLCFDPLRSDLAPVVAVVTGR